MIGINIKDTYVRLLSNLFFSVLLRFILVVSGTSLTSTELNKVSNVMHVIL